MGGLFVLGFLVIVAILIGIGVWITISENQANVQRAKNEEERIRKQRRSTPIMGAAQGPKNNLKYSFLDLLNMDVTRWGGLKEGEVVVVYENDASSDSIPEDIFEKGKWFGEQGIPGNVELRRGTYTSRYMCFFDFPSSKEAMFFKLTWGGYTMENFQ